VVFAWLTSWWYSCDEFFVLWVEEEEAGLLIASNCLRDKWGEDRQLHSLWCLPLLLMTESWRLRARCVFFGGLRMVDVVNLVMVIMVFCGVSRGRRSGGSELARGWRLGACRLFIGGLCMIDAVMVFCVVGRGRRRSGGAQLARNAQGCRQDNGEQPAAREGAFAAPR
jgi:hypothetical protein